MVDPLISHVARPEQGPQLYRPMLHGTSGWMSILFDWDAPISRRRRPVTPHARDIAGASWDPEECGLQGWFMEGSIWYPHACRP